MFCVYLRINSEFSKDIQQAFKDSYRYMHKKYYFCCIYRRGSSKARITNTAKVVHDMCTNKRQF